MNCLNRALVVSLTVLDLTDLSNQRKPGCRNTDCHPSFSSLDSYLRFVIIGLNLLSASMTQRDILDG